MIDDPKPLSPRHVRFVAEYLKDGNATQAYIRAGYAARGAQSCASRLLTQPHIEAAVAAGRQRLAQSLEVTVERLAQEYAKIAFANVGDFIEVDEDGRLRIDLTKASVAQRAGVVELTVTDHGKPWQTVRLKLGKLQALAALTRQIGVLVEKPAPGLTAEDRERYLERIARQERELNRRHEEQCRLERELHQTQVALAEAPAKIAVDCVEMPPAEARGLPEALRAELGPADTPETRAKRSYQQMPGMPTQPPPSFAPGLHPYAKIVWSNRRRPLNPPEPDEAPHMICSYDIFADLEDGTS